MVPGERPGRVLMSTMKHAALENFPVPQRCTLCTHAKRAAIEQQIVAGTSYRDVAAHFRISKSAIERHKDHIAAAVVQAAEARDLAFTDCVLTELELLHRTTLDILREAREGRKFEVPSGKDLKKKVEVYDHPCVKTSLRAIAEARKNLALLARLTGQLDPPEAARGGVTYEEFEAIYLRVRREVKST